MICTPEIEVRLIEAAGSDLHIVQAARVLMPNEDAATEEHQKRLIGYLMRHRHGTPFEHGMMSLLVRAPIFVFREMMRHRWLSFNEESARYKKLEARFWVPKSDRKMIPVNGFKCFQPEFEAADKGLHHWTCEIMSDAYEDAYRAYEVMIQGGVAREVARAVLPVGIYSSCWVTGNPRGFMSFLSLRTRDDGAVVKSYPQAEIQEVAKEIEGHLAKRWPLVYAAWNENGRQAV